MKKIERTREGGLKIDALVTNTVLAWDNAEVRPNYHMLSGAILPGVLQQIPPGDLTSFYLSKIGYRTLFSWVFTPPGNRISFID